MKLSFIVIVALVAVLSGCATPSNLGSAATLSLDSDEGIIVLGVDQQFRIQIKEGAVSNGVFQNSGFTAPSANLYPVDGYIVLQLNATSSDERYAVVQILPTGIFGKKFMPCKGAGAATFEVRRGTVAYLGDLKLALSEDKLQVNYSQDPTTAHTFIKQHYPKLDALYSESSLQPLPMNAVACNASNSVPFFITIPKH